MSAARQALGRYGEDRAQRWYVEQGYEILERNWRCRSGELDIVATDGHVLAVCEVKTRSTDRLGTGFEAVTVPKQQRLRRLAVEYVRSRGGWAGPIRFDVASIVGGRLEMLTAAF